MRRCGERERAHRSNQKMAIPSTHRCLSLIGRVMESQEPLDIRRSVAALYHPAPEQRALACIDPRCR